MTQSSTFVRIAFIAVATLALVACESGRTSQIGTTIDKEQSSTAPGSNSFRITFQESGIPHEAYVTSFKDEDDVMVRVTYPDGTEWLYKAGKSTGSTQTAAVLAVQQAVSAVQAQTGQVLGEAAIAAIQDAVLRSIGIQ